MARNTLTGIDIEFKNRPNDDGTLSNFIIKDCLVAPNGSPTVKRPQVRVHLPINDKTRVNGAWLEYDGFTYHVVGEPIPMIDENTPGRWNRYCVAERIY